MDEQFRVLPDGTREVLVLPTFRLWSALITDYASAQEVWVLTNALTALYWEVAAQEQFARAAAYAREGRARASVVSLASCGECWQRASENWEYVRSELQASLERGGIERAPLPYSLLAQATERRMWAVQQAAHVWGELQASCEKYGLPLPGLEREG